AMELHLDSWRWADVPFFIRAGKCMPLTATEVLVTLRQPPQRIFSGIAVAKAEPNYVRFRLGPEVEIAIGARAKAPGEARSRRVALLACREARDLMEPYDRLLHDAMNGDALLFAREDEVEAAWGIVDPILKRPSPVHVYEPGSFGPGEAERIVAHVGGWHEVHGPQPKTA